MTPNGPTFSYRPGEGEELSHAIIDALSQAKGRDVSDDDSTLYDVVDLDALDDIFSQPRVDNGVTVEFTTHGANVVLRSGFSGVTIDVHDQTERTEEFDE